MRRLLMRRISLVLIMLSLILILVLISGCFKEIPIQEVKKCEFDSDCILVYTVGCCKCPTTINRDYKDYWEKLGKRSNQDCAGVVCEPCGLKSIGQECRNNTCSLLYSPVGILI